MTLNGEDLSKANTFFENKIIKPVIDSVFEFKDAVKAYEKAATGRTVGKIVIEISK